MLIQVKQEHIDKGEREDCFGCPIFWALSEALGRDFSELGGSMVGISSKVIMITRPFKDAVELETPGPVRRRIRHYDRTGKMRPFSFELAIGA